MVRVFSESGEVSGKRKCLRNKDKNFDCILKAMGKAATGDIKAVCVLSRAQLTLEIKGWYNSPGCINISSSALYPGCKNGGHAWPDLTGAEL